MLSARRRASVTAAASAAARSWARAEPASLHCDSPDSDSAWAWLTSASCCGCPSRFRSLIGTPFGRPHERKVAVLAGARFARSFRRRLLGRDHRLDLGQLLLL